MATEIERLSLECDLSFDAVLLAGGRSRRMGLDKACLRLPSGELLWKRQHAILREAGASRIFLSVRREQVWPTDEFFCVYDRVADGGPLDGIIAAMRETRASHLIVLAVDLPALPATWFRELRAVCVPRRGAVGCRDDGVFEPLAGIYPTVWVDAWTAALKTGNRSLQSLLTTATRGGELSSVPIGTKRLPWFHNLNCPEDMLPFRSESDG